MTVEEILAGESKNVEFKENLPEKSIKYMKSVVAFANGTGGKIIFGITDKTREVVGFDKEDVFKKMDAIANTAVKPPLNRRQIADKMPANEQEQQIYKYISENVGITTAQAMKLLDIKQRRVREILVKMVENGWLRKEGASRSTIYVKNTEGK